MMRGLSFLACSILISLPFGASAEGESRYIELDANTRIKLPPEAPAREPGQEGSAAAGGTADPDDWERAERKDARGRRIAPQERGTAPPELLPPPAPAQAPEPGQEWRR